MSVIHIQIVSGVHGAQSQPLVDWHVVWSNEEQDNAADVTTDSHRTSAQSPLTPS